MTGVLLMQTACDLQPRVMSFPDSVGEFISARYPALLADPNTNPEIYNSAATDYGVYASPSLYGTDSDDNYVVYASVDDYALPVQAEETQKQELYGQEITDDKDDASDAEDVKTQEDAGKQEIVVATGDTLYSLAKKHNTTIQDLAKANNLEEPYSLSVGQKLTLAKEAEVVTATAGADDVLQIKKPSNVVRSATRVELKDITVQRGDTLYSLSRQYAIPVNDLAVMNNLTPPFSLSIGQKLRVPNLADAKVATVSEKQVAKTTVKQEAATGTTEVVGQKEVKISAAPVKKISSDPTKKLPTIGARSSSKFAWPVRGKILSAYGAKTNGLFNDGINIAASRGAAVKAAENGVVAYAGNEVKGMGNLVIIQHAGGWMTVYAHMGTMDVRRGNKVTVGQKIGTVGETGKVDSPQLHFEIRKGTKAYNPSTYLKK